MKSASIFLALAFVLVSLPTAMAFSPADLSIDGFKVRVKHLEGKHFKLQVINLQQQTTRVTIEDLDGADYFRDLVKDHNGYLKTFDVSDLPDGRYILRVTNREKTVSKVIYINQEAIRISGITG